MADPAVDVVAEAVLDQAEGTRGPTAVSVRQGLVRVTAVVGDTEVDLAAVVVSQPLRAGDRAGGRAAEGRWGYTRSTYLHLDIPTALSASSILPFLYPFAF